MPGKSAAAIALLPVLALLPVWAVFAGADGDYVSRIIDTALPDAFSGLTTFSF